MSLTDFNPSQLREGDMVHAGDQIIEISRRITGDLDGNLVIHGFKGPFTGEIDYDVEHQIDPASLEELVTPTSVRKRLRSGPHYHEGLAVGAEKAVEFFHNYGLRFASDEARTDFEMAVSLWRQQHS